MGSADPSQSGVNKHKGTAAGGRPGLAPSRGGGVRASEGTNPCTRPSFATKNVFDVLQDLSESIGGSPGPQLDAADGQPEPIVHDLHQSLVELLERPEILSLHAVRRVGRERQLHLKVRALCGEVEKVFDVLVDTGAQVSLVKAGLLPPECLTDSRKPVRLKVANGQYMVGGTKEAAIAKVARNCMDASAIFIINTRNLNPNFSGCRNRTFDFDIPALDLTSFEWTYVLPYTRINFPFILPSICLKDMGKTKLIREATCEGHISCRLRVLTIRKRGTYSQYYRRNLGSLICLAFPHVRASVMDHGQEGRVCVITLWP